jgi:hypothetical protein
MNVDEHSQLDAMVAAILTVAVVGTDGISPTYAVERYREILNEMRKTGGALSSIKSD